MSRLNRVGMVTTAWRRPAYLKRSLASWKAARGSDQLGLVAVALRPDPEFEDEQRRVIYEADLDAKVWPDRLPPQGRAGMHRAIAEAADLAFAHRLDFLIFGEEDVPVSDDVLEYMSWAQTRFADDKRVLAVCAHSQGGQGWDVHEPAQDADADQRQVRRLPYFNAWCWGTWADRWKQILEPEWDYDCTSGGPATSGWDWNIQTRILRGHNALCVVPDASRSQNIGSEMGVYSTPRSFAFSQAQSFREHREPVNYLFVEEK